MPFQKDFNYNLISRIFHRITLQSNMLQNAFFDLEKFLFLDKNSEIQTKSLFITGLARSGSTILLNNLYDTGYFASLKYSDMPFILCPNLWRKINIFNFKKDLKQIRAHNDGIEFNYTSPEAFEEVFWRAQSITKKNDIEILKNFNQYQSLVLKKEKKNIYLSKNNNNIIRLDLLKKKLNKKIIIVLFRKPLNQAFSLLTQHQNFINIQNKNPFVLEYMNYLSHYEFGLNHKPLFFKEFKSSCKTNDINYWLDYWIFIYSKLSKFVEKDKDIIFLSYETLKLAPLKILNNIIKIFDEKFAINKTNILDKVDKKITFEINKKKFKIANDLYEFIKCYEIKS